MFQTLLVINALKKGKVRQYDVGNAFHGEQQIFQLWQATSLMNLETVPQVDQRRISQTQ